MLPIDLGTGTVGAAVAGVVATIVATSFGMEKLIAVAFGCLIACSSAAGVVMVIAVSAFDSEQVAADRVSLRYIFHICITGVLVAIIVLFMALHLRRTPRPSLKKIGIV